ncbi:hypothetical protein CO046_02950 [Candidatus Peregrinibacteria bacterium CG_4_9_14_0_2_um_filter_53_11]|nr:MAG: hypothetical protein CO046_02950 [Candidatus Peregrinibacteria bacterium CG_4_9_14_0_2_um_filter_53_11]
MTPYDRKTGTLDRFAALKKNFSAGDHAPESIVQRLKDATLLLEVIAEINLLMGRSMRFDLFCQAIAEVLGKRFEFKLIHIWIRQEQKPDILELLTPELPGEHRTVSISQGIIGKTTRAGKTVFLEDVHTDPDYISAREETNSEICIPLRFDDRIMGVLNIEAGTSDVLKKYLPLLEVVSENLCHSLRVAYLRETEERFKNLVESMTEAVCVIDHEKRIVYANNSLLRISGCNLEELKNQKLTRLLPKVNDTNQRDEGALDAMRELKLSAKNGEKIPVIVNSVPFENSLSFNEGGQIITMTDLRSLRSTEKRLQQTEQFLASITQNCQEAIVGLDEHGVIHSWNVGAERMFGYKSQEVIGKSTHIIIPEDRIETNEIQSIIREAQEKSYVRNFETVRLHKNGKPILISLTMSAIYDRKDRIIGLSALYRDITAQKKWEREIQDRFEKMQEAYREMGKQRRYMDYLSEMISIASTPGVTQKQIASFIVNAVLMISRSDAATIRLLNHSTGKLVLTAQSGVTEDWASKKQIPYAGSLLEQAVQSSTPLKILDIVNNPHYVSPSLARKNNLRSALVIPLECKNYILGSLTLYLSQEGNLSLLDDEFITIFSQQAAVALKLVLS